MFNDNLGAFHGILSKKSPSNNIDMVSPIVSVKQTLKNSENTI